MTRRMDRLGELTGLNERAFTMLLRKERLSDES
jgi:hypothetical protein